MHKLRDFFSLYPINNYNYQWRGLVPQSQNVDDPYNVINSVMQGDLANAAGFNNLSFTLDHLRQPMLIPVAQSNLNLNDPIYRHIDYLQMIYLSTYWRDYEQFFSNSYLVQKEQLRVGLIQVIANVLVNNLVTFAFNPTAFVSGMNSVGSTFSDTLGTGVALGLGNLAYGLGKEILEELFLEQVVTNVALLCGASNQLVNQIGESTGFTWNTLTNIGKVSGDSKLTLGISPYRQVDHELAQNQFQLAGFQSLIRMDARLLQAIDSKLMTPANDKAQSRLALSAITSQLRSYITSQTLTRVIQTFRMNTLLTEGMIQVALDFMSESEVKDAYLDASFKDAKFQIRGYDNIILTDFTRQQVIHTALFVDRHLHPSEFLTKHRENFGVPQEKSHSLVGIKKGVVTWIFFESGEKSFVPWNSKIPINPGISLQDVGDCLSYFDFVQMVDPWTGKRNAKGYKIYNNIPSRNHYFNSFKNDDGSHWTDTSDYADFMAQNQLAQLYGQLSGEFGTITGDLYTKSKESIGESTFYKKFYKLSSASKYSAIQIYQDILMKDASTIPQKAITENSINVHELKSHELWPYLWTGEIQLEGYENIKLGSDSDSDRTNRQALLDDLFIMSMVEYKTLQRLQFQIKGFGQRSYILWDMFDMLIDNLPEGCIDPIQSCKQYPTPGLYYEKLREIAIQFETWKGPNAADAWMTWMTSKYLEDIASKWRYEVTSVDEFNTYSSQLNFKTIEEKYSLLSHRRNYLAAKEYVQAWEIIGLIGDVTTGKCKQIPYGHREDKSTVNSYRVWTLLENNVNNLAILLSGSNDIDLFGPGNFDLRDIYYWYYRSGSIPFKLDLAILLDLYGQILKSPFDILQSQYVDTLPSAASNSFDAFMNHHTHDVHTTLLEASRPYSPSSFPHIFQDSFIWTDATTSRHYSLDSFTDLKMSSFFMRTGTLPITYMKDEAVFQYEVGYEWGNEKYFDEQIIANHPTFGSSNSWLRGFVGSEKLGMRKVASGIVPYRPTVHNSFLEFNGQPYLFNDEVKSEEKGIYMDKALLTWDNFPIFIELLGYTTPSYVLRKNMDDQALDDQGIAIWGILGRKVDLATYLDNCDTIGSVLPLFYSIDDFIYFSRVMLRLTQDTRFWKTSTQPYSTLEVIQFPLSTWESFIVLDSEGLITLNFVAVHQNRFGVNPDGSVQSQMQPWFYNFRNYLNRYIDPDTRTHINLASYLQEHCFTDPFGLSLPYR